MIRSWSGGECRNVYVRDTHNGESKMTFRATMKVTSSHWRDIIYVSSIKSFELSDLLNLDADDDCNKNKILKTLAVLVALVVGT